MSFLTPQGSRRRSTFYDEDLGEVVDLSEHGTWAKANLCEVIQDLVDALFPLQAMSEGHEERLAALGAVQKDLQTETVEVAVSVWNPEFGVRAYNNPLSSSPAKATRYFTVCATTRRIYYLT